MIYTLLDGREMTGDELTEFYRYNLRNGLLPVAGYFCPKCNHEVLEVDAYSEKCFNCDKKVKGDLKNE